MIGSGSTLRTGEPTLLTICTDCVMLLANDEGTDQLRVQIAALWGNTQITLGCLTEQCVDAGYHAYPCTEETEPWFDNGACDGCGDHLAGDRQHATAWVVTTEPMPDPSDVPAVENWLVTP